jgi:hypothetical protein
MKLGPPRSANNLVRVSITSSAVIERSVSSARHFLLYYLTMGIIFSLRPSFVASITKS